MLTPERIKELENMTPEKRWYSMSEDELDEWLRLREVPIPVYVNIVNIIVFKFKNLYYNVIYFFQRIFRKSHASDSDLMKLDDHLAKILSEKLKAFKLFFLKINPVESVTIYFKTENYEEEINKKEWVNILDKMIKAFELYSTGTINAESKEFEEGIKLFLKYYDKLNDMPLP